MMEADLGKLFIGGISWDTDEERLKEYFSSYGEVIEAVIMKDRNTGRARGFGFVIFANPAVAERVVNDKHIIDGRTVEAKKAVPRDDQHIINRNNSSIQGSPGPGRTKKIFVGGLASTVTESDFKTYFDQFGTITDVVVMYDHNTQRPRGFGFITYDSEDAVDRALYKTFQDLNGKMIEVKHAVPKELYPGPNRSTFTGYNFGLGRVNNFLNNYAQGYSLGSVGGYGLRVEGKFSPVASGRTSFSQFSSPAYGMGVNLDPALSPTFAGSSNFSNNLGYGRVLNPYFTGNSSRYTTPIGYSAGSSRGDSLLNSPRNLWGNGGLNSSPSPGSSGSFLGSGPGSYGVFGNNGANWGASAISAPLGSASGYGGRNVGFRSGVNSYGLRSGGLARSCAAAAVPTSFAASNGAFEGSYGDVYRSGSMYGDPTWQAVSSDMDGSNTFGYELENPADEAPKDSENYIGNYSIANRQSNRGIAA